MISAVDELILKNIEHLKSSVGPALIEATVSLLGSESAKGNEYEFLGNYLKEYCKRRDAKKHFQPKQTFDLATDVLEIRTPVNTTLLPAEDEVVDSFEIFKNRQSICFRENDDEAKNFHNHLKLLIEHEQEMQVDCKFGVLSCQVNNATENESNEMILKYKDLKLFPNECSFKDFEDRKSVGDQEQKSSFKFCFSELVLRARSDDNDADADETKGADDEENHQQQEESEAEDTDLIEKDKDDAAKTKEKAEDQNDSSVKQSDDKDVAHRTDGAKDDHEAEFNEAKQWVKDNIQELFVPNILMQTGEGFKFPQIRNIMQPFQAKVLAFPSPLSEEGNQTNYHILIKVGKRLSRQTTAIKQREEIFRMKIADLCIQLSAKTRAKSISAENENDEKTEVDEED